MSAQHAGPEKLVPLLVRSCYSMLRGVPKPDDWIAAAKREGLGRIALSDRNGLYGIPGFVEACRKAGIVPIAGTELVYEGGRCLLIPRTRQGFSVITRLLTDRAGKASFDCRVEIAGLFRAGVAQGDAVGPALFVISDDEALLDAVLPRPGVFALVTPLNREKWPALQRLTAAPLATPECSFFDPVQREVQRLLVAIGRKRNLRDIPEEDLDPAEALWNPALLCPCSADGSEVLREWRPPSAMASWMETAFASNAFVAREALAEPFGGFVFPRHESGDSARTLRRLVMEGAARRYRTIDARVEERIGYELGLIDSKGFSDYFLVVNDIVKKASRTCGRGSAAASIVAYCLGITDVDPLRHNLYFERFLNPGRKDPPDIDVDFAWDERDALLEDVVATYGATHCARVANHNCFRSRSALRETARASGMPDTEIAAFERSLRVDSGGTMSSADPEWQKVAALATKIVGLPHHLGTHSGGVIIVPDALADHAPIEETGNGIRVVAWDKEGVETAGLVKIDLLGNRSLAVVRDAVTDLRSQGLPALPGSPLDAGNWHPVDDPSTIALLARGDTMGVFYVESPAMRLLQVKTGRGDYGHLVIHSSIIRPAANRYIDEYVDRLKGKPWKAFHPLLEGLFDESYGILCYQEDVSRAAIALAGFSASEADAIRKILAKKDADTRIQEYQPAFFEGARARGVDEASIEAVWGMIRSFSGYSFVKAHSASYAMVSFQSAYLRAHHPAEFMAAVMSNHGGYYSTLAYASESRRMGLVLLPPDVNLGDWRCHGEGRRIRFGFCMVASLSAAVAAAIVEERSRAGLYRSVEDFSARVRFERGDAEALVGSGAFDSLLPPGGDFAKSRASALMTLFSLCAAQETSGAGAGELFEDEPAVRAREGARSGPPHEDAPGTEGRQGEETTASLRKRRLASFKYLGTTLDCHPLELWPRLCAMPRDRARDLSRKVGRRVRILCWPITAKPVLTASDEPMEFVSFEDETALFEGVLFPEAYKSFRHLLFEEKPLWVEGLVEKDRGAVTLTVESVADAAKEALPGRGRSIAGPRYE